MTPMTDKQLKEWLDLAERRPPTIDRDLMLAALQTALTELRDLRAARVASRDRVVALVMEALDAPGSPLRTSAWCQLTATRVADALAAPQPAIDAARLRVAELERQAAIDARTIDHQARVISEQASEIKRLRIDGDIAARGAEQLSGQALSLTSVDREILGWVRDDAPHTYRGDLVRRLCERLLAGGVSEAVALSADEREVATLWRDEIRAEGQRLADFGHERARVALLDRLLSASGHVASPAPHLPPRKEWTADAYERGACPSPAYVEGWNDAIAAMEFPSRTRNRSADQASNDVADPQTGWRAGIEASIRRLEAQARKPRDLWHAAYFAAIDESLVHLRAMLERGAERGGDTVAAEPQTAATEPSAPDADTCRRLASEAAEDDARMTCAPWRPCSCGLCGLVWSTKYDVIVVANACDGDRGRQEDSDGIARTRNNLPEVARQLTAAAELAERHERTSAAGDSGQRCAPHRRHPAEITSEIEERALSWSSVAVEALSENDELRAELARIVGGGTAPRTWAVTPERVEALRWARWYLAGGASTGACEATRQALVEMLAEVP